MSENKKKLQKKSRSNERLDGFIKGVYDPETTVVLVSEPDTDLSR